MGPRRFLGCPCHAAIADDATIVLCHPCDAYVWHGHAANRFAVGVEISSADGLITDLQAAAAQALIRYIVDDLREHRGPAAPIVAMAHRQSHKSRVNDPGPYIWQDVAEPMMDELALPLGPVVGSGAAIPDRWLIRLEGGA
jgi:N-acetyl-anhydromuramyl-L-alanine amidase AmpD